MWCGKQQEGECANRIGKRDVRQRADLITVK